MARTTMTYVLVATLLNVAYADLRLASRPADNQNQGGQYRYKLRNENGAINFQDTKDVYYKYMEPSTFEYQGLAGNNGQKRKNYDNFLRSNIDNEQDNRNFVNNDGADHLPFRTLETRVLENEAQVDLTCTLKEGQQFLTPLRWNNPHASECEVNLWVFRQPSQTEAQMPTPVVVPFMKPVCCGEGYQDAMFNAKVPAQVVAKLYESIPGFTGCTANSNPMCSLQIYGHSVESRMYSIGVPTVINEPLPTTNPATTFNVPEAPKDVEMDLNKLTKPVCMSSADADKHVAVAAPQRARLMSDVFNHAYQNSDFSPYAGQQPTLISQNLQASCINKMVTGNRGELGKAAIPNAMKNKLQQLRNQENKIYKRYEALANNLIKRYQNQMSLTATGQVAAAAGNGAVGTTQQLANTFRANEVGSTKQNRQQTNTYIPSFQIAAKTGGAAATTELINKAKQTVPAKYRDNLVQDNGLVQIYKAAYTDLLPLYKEAAEQFGINYMGNHFKDTLTNAADVTQFKKRNANGQQDNGQYAGVEAIKKMLTKIGCVGACHNSAAGTKPGLYKGSQGTNIQGNCVGCATQFQIAQGITVQDTDISTILAAGDDAALPGLGEAQEIEDYPDTDGTERIGRPPSPSTTTRKTYEPPPGWTGLGGAGVVGAAMRPIFDVCLMGMLVLVVAMRD